MNYIRKNALIIFVALVALVSVILTVYVLTPKTGDLCVTLSDEQAQALAGCSIDFMQLRDDPKPVASNQNCSGKGQYFFENVPVGRFDIVVTCDGHPSQSEVDVSADSLTRLISVTQESVPAGELCTTKFGLSLDPENSSVDVGRWLGFGSNDSCVPATAQQLAGMTVTAIVQYDGPGTCMDMTDPNCPIEVKKGLSVSMKKEGFKDFRTDEVRRFDLTLRKDNSTTHVYVVTVNRKANHY